MAGLNGRTKMEKLWMNSIENNYVHIISNLECVSKVISGRNYASQRRVAAKRMKARNLQASFSKRMAILR